MVRGRLRRPGGCPNRGILARIFCWLMFSLVIGSLRGVPGAPGRGCSVDLGTA